MKNFKRVFESIRKKSKKLEEFAVVRNFMEDFEEKFSKDTARSTRNEEIKEILWEECNVCIIHFQKLM